MILRILVAAFLILVAALYPVSAYGKSVEDLVGSFSISKEIKIGSSSECFSSEGSSDPLTPPASSTATPLSDDQAPGIAGLTIQPGQISQASPQPVNLTAHLIDDQAIWAAEAEFSGPGGENATALFSSPNLTQGTARDGFYYCQISLPGNKSGEWHLQSFTLVDGDGNRKELSESDLIRLNLPTLITVIP